MPPMKTPSNQKDAMAAFSPATGSALVGGLLVCLAEECAEIGQSACKALRFGLRDEFRGEGLWPERDIAAELDDLRAIVELLEAEGLGLASDPARIAAKKAKLAKMNAYAESKRQEAQNDQALPQGGAKKGNEYE
jgi:hypothetical protein